MKPVADTVVRSSPGGLEPVAQPRAAAPSTDAGGHASAGRACARAAATGASVTDAIAKRTARNANSG